MSKFLAVIERTLKNAKSQQRKALPIHTDDKCNIGKKEGWLEGD
jgi:hypothetical protein